jgi:hypothetical protein
MLGDREAVCGSALACSETEPRHDFARAAAAAARQALPLLRPAMPSPPVPVAFGCVAKSVTGLCLVNERDFKLLWL